jgi:hypothetical protein
VVGEDQNNRLILILLGGVLYILVAAMIVAVFKKVQIEPAVNTLTSLIAGGMLAAFNNSRKQGAEVTGQGSTVNVTQPVKEEVKP